MTTFRTTIVLDFLVDDDTDPDEFHDALMKHCEDQTRYHEIPDPTDIFGGDVVEIELESVRQIDIEPLED